MISFGFGVGFKKNRVWFGFGCPVYSVSDLKFSLDSSQIRIQMVIEISLLEFNPSSPEK